ncbi:MAG TPA: hypothetical protein VK324_16610 [Tepidisphaeraceae bacterium]|nr:hypothetical protein [Tepidisphaeraceae bacterium]
MQTTISPSALAPAAPATAGRVVMVVGLALAATAVGLAAILVLVNRPAWWPGLLAAGVVSALSAGLSLIPLTWGLRRPKLEQRVAGYLVALGVRGTVSLGGCLLAVMVGRYPAAPTLLLMVVFYLAVLAAETSVVVRTMWNHRD